MQAWELAIAYHEETKHHYRRFARSAGYLDWANQPNPFRRYTRTDLLPLSHSSVDVGPKYDGLFVPGLIAPSPVNGQSISLLFEFALALSAWKEFKGSRWALRINPSSGNLHPTEGYLVCGAIAGTIETPGVFHYAPKEHALERRATIADTVWKNLVSGFPAGAFLVGLTSIHWREAWKYGERAYRYCQHDAGHALAALAISAALNGWDVRPLSTTSDDEIADLLGLNRDHDYVDAEREAPDLMVAILPQGHLQADIPLSINADVDANAQDFSWHGRANQLSAEHVEWELIAAVEDACHRSTTLGRGDSPSTITATHSDILAISDSDISLRVNFKPDTSSAIFIHGEPVPAPEAIAARQIIRQRRSAVAMDGHTEISSATFFRMLDRVMPRFDRAPWNGFGVPVCVHLGLFVHRVVGIDAGLYFLVRDALRLAELKSALNPQWEWQKPDGCPADLPLFRLTVGDLCTLAAQVSCTQDIAGDGAFSCGMIAEFERPLREYGAWFYRRLFWETGVIGQVLYLEAEAAGVRATGIGCFFDDAVHDVFGFTGKAWQSLYHFTVGGPVEDNRLTTLPAYPATSIG